MLTKKICLTRCDMETWCQPFDSQTAWDVHWALTSNGLCRAISELSKPIKNPTPSFSKRTETIVDSKRNAGFFFFLHAVIQFKCSTLPHVRCCSFIFSTFSTDLIVIFSIHKSRHWGNKRHANFNLFFFYHRGFLWAADAWRPRSTLITLFCCNIQKRKQR